MTMNALLSFSAASALALLDLGALRLAVSRLGRRGAPGSGLGLALAVPLKLAVLALGLAWISRQPWYDRRAMIAGLLAPFALFIAWQALSPRLRAPRRAEAQG